MTTPNTSIIAELTPDQVEDTCGVVASLDCEEQIFKNSSGDLSLVFPTTTNNVVPLAGGAILKIDVTNLGLSATKDVNNIVKKRLNSLKDLVIEPSLEGLIELREGPKRSKIPKVNFDKMEIAI